MRDSHLEQVERGTDFIRNNPAKWKKIHTEFINAIFQKNEEFIKKVRNTSEGREKLIHLYNIKDKEVFKMNKS